MTHEPLLPGEARLVDVQGYLCRCVHCGHVWLSLPKKLGSPLALPTRCPSRKCWRWNWRGLAVHVGRPRKDRNPTEGSNG